MKRQGYYITLVCILLVLTGVYFVRTEIYFHGLKLLRKTNGLFNDINNMKLYTFFYETEEALRSYLNIQIIVNKEASKPMLIKYLGSSDPEDAYLALSLLSNPQFDLKSDYVRIIKDPKFTNVKNHIIRLISLNPQDGSGLIPLLKDPDIDEKTRIMCLISIRSHFYYNIRNKELLDIVKKFLNDKNPEIRATAIIILGEHKTNIQLIKPMLKENDENIRYSFINIFKNNKETLYPDILCYLDDKNPKIVRKTIETISPYMDKQAIPYLKKLKESSHDAEIKAQAEELLKKIEKARKQDEKFSRDQ